MEKNKKRGRGRPTKEIDWEQAAKLTELHLDAEQVAYALGVSYYHFLKAIKEKFGYDWRQFREIHRTNAKISIIRKQYELAKKGNIQMLKWLGTNWCGQSERQMVEVDVGINMLSPEEIAERIVSTLIKYPEIETQIIQKLPIEEGGNGEKGVIIGEIEESGQRNTN